MAQGRYPTAEHANRKDINSTELRDTGLLD